MNNLGNYSHYSANDEIELIRIINQIKFVFTCEDSGIECSIILKDNEITFLKEKSEYFSSLIDNLSEDDNIITLNESNPIKSVQFLQNVVNNQIDDITSWDTYNAILSSKWLIDSYVNKYRRLAASHIDYMISFERNLKQVHFSEDIDSNPAILLYNTDLSVVGYYDLASCQITPFYFEFISRRNDSSYLLIQVNNMNRLTIKLSTFLFTCLTPLDYQLSYSILHGHWEYSSFNLKMKVVPSYKNVKLLWEIFAVMSTHQHAYGEIDRISSKNDMIDLLASHRDFWIVDEMKKLLTSDEIFQLFSLLSEVP